jgi:hypothetical protein
MSTADFDADRAMLKGPDFFKRFVVQGEGEPLGGLGLPDDTELMVVERLDQRVAFVMRELAYPHMAQGKLAGEPYLVSF